MPLVVVVVVVVVFEGGVVYVRYTRWWWCGNRGMEEAHVMQRQFLHVLYRKRVM